MSGLPPIPRWLSVTLWLGLLGGTALAQDAGVPACPAVPVGSACAADADCGPDGLCFEGVVGGYCTPRRALNCCPPGSRILDGLQVCVRECQTARDCPDRPGRRCTPEAFCWGCLAAPPSAPLGEACATDADCGGAGCLRAAGEQTIEGGVCTLDVPAYCCPRGTGPGALGDAEWCLPTCRVDADCARAGWGCDHAARGVCRPGAQAPALPEAGPPDAGPRDAGPRDAGPARDATLDRGPAVADARPRADAQPTEPVTCPEPDGGCRAVGQEPTPLWLCMLAFALLRRRSNRARAQAV